MSDSITSDSTSDRRFDATAMTKLSRVGAVAPSPCGTWLAVAVARLDNKDARYVTDLWRVSLDDSGRAPVQLTRGEQSDTKPRFRRDGSLCFLSNRPTDDAAVDNAAKHAQVWMLPVHGGEAVPLTDEPLGVDDFRFAAAADRLVLLANVLPNVPHDSQRQQAKQLAEGGPTGLHYTGGVIRQWDHWIERAATHVIAYDERGTQRRDLTPDADRVHRDNDWGFDWDLSADGTRVVIPATRIAPDRMPACALRIIDIDTGTHIDVGAADDLMHMQPKLSPDGLRIACTTHRRKRGSCERPALHVYSVDGGDGDALAADWDAWPTLCGWTPDGKALLATADIAGFVPAFHVDVSSGDVTRLIAEAAGGTHGQLHAVVTNGVTQLVGVRHCMHHPPEPFVASLSPHTQSAAPRLLACLSGFTAERGRAIASWRSLETPGDGGTPVQWFLMTPATWSEADAPRASLMWIHGGPIGQASDGWHWRWNPLVLAAAGYVLAMPNPRGSTGFGQQFIEGIWNNTWGEACYRDLMAVADAMETQPCVDAARIAAMGGSFGGYMTNWIGGQTDRFQALITHAGLYWLSAFHGTTDYPAYFADELGGSPYDDLAAFDRYSPHTQVANWRTPTLIIHGEKDYRVPISEALLLFEGLQHYGVASELLVYPDENHWILKPRNARQWYERCITFLAEHLT